MQRLTEGNLRSLTRGGEAKRIRTAREGQHPYAVVVCCSDSRVIPEKIFDADIGELFVIRVAGNVLGAHQLGSIAYAVEHLGTRTVVMLGHTGCGAVAAALNGHADGFVASIVQDIRAAIGTEGDPNRACELNVRHGVNRIREAFADEPIEVLGAVYDIETGKVDWLNGSFAM